MNAEEAQEKRNLVLMGDGRALTIASAGAAAAWPIRDPGALKMIDPRCNEVMRRMDIRPLSKQARD